MKNFIQLNGKQIGIDPMDIKTVTDLDEITTACVQIMGLVLCLGTNGYKDDKARVEAVMNNSGKIGGGMAKRALLLIANSKAAEQPAKEEPPVEEEPKDTGGHQDA